jgi:hypothetical protein
MIPLLVAFLWAVPLDPAATLARVLDKTRADLRRMPNYTCVETITRELYRPIAPVRRDCEVVLAMKQSPTLDMQLRPFLTDRLRLEVALSGRGEMHSWAGEARFDERPIDQLVRHGPLGTGMFGAFLAAIFNQDVRRFHFQRELTVDGHDRLEFSFDVAEKDSHYRVKMRDSWVTTAYRGTVEVDQATEELTRIWVQTAVLPAAAGTCQTSTELALAMAEIGSGRFPLTTVARQRFVASNGEEAVNATRISSCREYRGESAITFDGDATRSTALPSRASASTDAIPPNQKFTIELAERIDPAVAAAGDRFTARLTTPLRDVGSKTIAPLGARVEGRLLRVQQYHGPRAELVVVLRPESVEVRGMPVPLAAVSAPRRMNPKTAILLPHEWETNATLLRFPGEGATVPKGIVTQWRTVPR